MERRLSKQLQEKIARFDISKPYVWKLKLSEADFNEIETCLTAYLAENSISSLDLFGNKRIYPSFHTDIWYFTVFKAVALYFLKNLVK